MVKYPSADRIGAHKNSVQSLYTGEELILVSEDLPHNHVMVMENKHSTLRRERGSAPTLETQAGRNLGMQKGMIMDPNYQMDLARSSSKQNPFSATLVNKGMNSKGKVPRPNRVYYSQSPAMSEDRRNGKFTCLHYVKVYTFAHFGFKILFFIGLSKFAFTAPRFNVRRSPNASNCSRRVIKVSSNNKKFPKDFF